MNDAKVIIQNILLSSNALLRRSGLLQTQAGQALFEIAYEAYKTSFDARSLACLRNVVRPGSTVVDVGANIGFFSRRFAQWVGPAGRVLAVEPEPANLARLRRALDRVGSTDRVEVIAAALAETAGRGRLALHDSNPADHRLAEQGIDIALERLDDVLSERGWPDLCLVKLDVQGAEERVLQGAQHTLTRIRPAWFVEFHDASLVPMGSSARALLDCFLTAGYDVRKPKRRGLSQPISAERVLAGQSDGRYDDFLMTPVEHRERFAAPQE